MSILALDIANKFATFCGVLSPQGETKQGSLTFDRAGFSSFLANDQVSAASLFVMESTGGYHLPLYHLLLNHGKKARIINPLLIKHFYNGQTLRRTKINTLDAVTIAQYAQTHMSALQEDRMKLDSESKLLARRRALNAEDLAKAKTILKRDLSVAFPELLTFNVFTKTLLESLFLFGSANNVLACQVRDEELTEALVQLEKTLHNRQMGILISIPGIGGLIAAHFFSEIPDITQFSTYQKVIAFAGTNPGTYESGNTSKSLRISKHGNPLLRKYPYLMADSCVKHNIVFNAYYHKKRDAGFPHRKAMLATMNKLVRTLHSLLTKDEVYKI